jgi:hypothetical protein
MLGESGLSHQVHSREGLVQEKDVGPLGQGVGHKDALKFSSRKVPQALVQEVRATHPV